MKTNRTIEILRTYNFAQRNHWQLMCDLSNNDYDIHYFDGRQSANITLDEFLQDQKRLNIKALLKFLSDIFIEYSEKQVKFYHENNYFSEYLRGYIAEISLLIGIVKQEYD